MKNIFFILLLISISGCIRKEVDGIKIGHNLYDTQTVGFNHTLCSLIEQTINGESQSLKQLINLSDGEAAGSYDKGDVIVQILKKIGERKFIKMAVTLNKENRSSLQSYLTAGIEYGQETNPKNLEKEFPELSKLLSN